MQFHPRPRPPCRRRNRGPSERQQHSQEEAVRVPRPIRRSLTTSQGSGALVRSHPGFVFFPIKRLDNGAARNLPIPSRHSPEVFGRKASVSGFTSSTPDVLSGCQASHFRRCLEYNCAARSYFRVPISCPTHKQLLWSGETEKSASRSFYFFSQADQVRETRV